MTPIFPDCYDEWGLYEDQSSADGSKYHLLFEGTEEACREKAEEYWRESVREGDGDDFPMFLMDWEGREWEV